MGCVEGLDGLVVSVLSVRHEPVYVVGSVLLVLVGSALRVAV